MLNAKIRTSKIEDAEGICELYPDWGFEVARQRIQKSLVSGKEKRYVAVLDNEIIGHLLVKIGSGKHSHTASFYSLKVKQGFRKKGIGKTLVKNAIEKLPEKIEIVLISATQDNKASVELFKKLGFEEYGFLELGWKKGSEYKSQVFMSKKLIK